MKKNLIRAVYFNLFVVAGSTTSIFAQSRIVKPATHYDLSKPLNVLYIMSDDHTSQAIGAYHSRLAKLNPTPNIDQLADDGVVFTNCFDTNSISTPSRACIITGQYSQHNGILTLDDSLDPSQEYLPQYFKALGYQTAMIGKWHLHCEPSAFDFYQILVGHGGQGTYFDPVFATSTVKGSYPYNTAKYQGYSSDIITNLTLDWLKKKRDKTKPFFLMHHYKAPHDMFEFAPRYKYYLEDTEIPEPNSLYDQTQWGSEGTRGKNDSLRRVIGTSISSRHETRNYVQTYDIASGDSSTDTHLAYQEYLKRYLRCVKGVDDNLERLFDYLKKAGLWDNTIIVYTGDQGMMLGEHDLQDKRWMYDESERMPLIIRDPRSQERGVTSDLLVNNIDFAPTLLDLAGLKKTPKKMDGKSFACIFDGKSPKHWRDAVYYRYWMHMIHHDIPAHLGIRTKHYKLILFYGKNYDSSRRGEQTMWWLKNNASHKIVPTPVSFELYDMIKDPHEMINLANDPKYTSVLQMMKHKLLLKRIEVDDTDDQYPEIKKIVLDALRQ